MRNLYGYSFDLKRHVSTPHRSTKKTLLTSPSTRCVWITNYAPFLYGMYTEYCTSRLVRLHFRKESPWYSASARTSPTTGTTLPKHHTIAKSVRTTRCSDDTLAMLRFFWFLFSGPVCAPARRQREPSPPRIPRLDLAAPARMHTTQTLSTNGNRWITS